MTEQSGISLKTALAAWMRDHLIGTINITTRVNGGEDTRRTTIDVQVTSTEGFSLGSFSSTRPFKTGSQDFIDGTYDFLVKFLGSYAPGAPVRFGVELGWESVLSDAEVEPPAKKSSDDVVYTGQPVIADPKSIMERFRAELTRRFSEALESVRTAGGSWSTSLEAVNDPTGFRSALAQFTFAAVPGELPAKQIQISAHPDSSLKSSAVASLRIWTPGEADEREDLASGLCLWIERLLSEVSTMPNGPTSIDGKWTRCIPQGEDPAEKQMSGGRHSLKDDSDTPCADKADPAVASFGHDLETIHDGLTRKQLEQMIMDAIAAVRNHRDAAQIGIDINTSIKFPGIANVVIIRMAALKDGAVKVNIQPMSELNVSADSPTLWCTTSVTGDKWTAENLANTWLDAVIKSHPKLKQHPELVSFRAHIVEDGLLPTSKDWPTENPPIAQRWEDLSHHLDCGLGHASANDFSMALPVDLLLPDGRTKAGKTLMVTCEKVDSDGKQKVIAQLLDAEHGEDPIVTRVLYPSSDKAGRDAAVETFKQMLPPEAGYLPLFKQGWRAVFTDADQPDDTKVGSDIGEADSVKITPYDEFTKRPLTPHLLRELFQKFGDSTDSEITIGLEPDSKSIHWIELVRHASGLFTLTVLLASPRDDVDRTTLTAVVPMRSMDELLEGFWFLNTPLASQLTQDTDRRLEIVTVNDPDWTTRDYIPAYQSDMGQVESDTVLHRAYRCIPVTGGPAWADCVGVGSGNQGLGWYGDIFDAAITFRKTLCDLPLRHGAAARRVIDGYVCDVFNFEAVGERWVRALNEFIEGHAIQLNSTMAQNRWYDYVGYANRDGVRIAEGVARIAPKNKVSVICRYTGIDHKTKELIREFSTEPANSLRIR